MTVSKEKTKLEGDPPPPLFSVRIVKIVLQPDKYKPVSMKPVELEAIQLKRARVGFVIREGQKRVQAFCHY
jgi:hypothetical protein